MLEIQVIASGSNGNCTLVKSSASETILFDAGIPYKKIPCYVDYAIITHEHGDHAHIPTIKKLLANGTEIYMTAGTKDALKLSTRHNLHTIKAGLEMSPIKLGSCELKALNAIHDATEPIVFQVYDSEDRVLYSTDTMHPPNWYGEENAFTKILVEANYSEPKLAESEIEEWRKKRVYENHTSIERVIMHFESLKKYEGTKLDVLPKLKEIHLIHISKQNGNAEQFKAMLETVIDNVLIYTH